MFKEGCFVWPIVLVIIGLAMTGILWHEGKSTAAGGSAALAALIWSADSAGWLDPPGDEVSQVAAGQSSAGKGAVEL